MKQIKKISTIVIAFILCFITMLSGVGCQIGSGNNSYNPPEVEPTVINDNHSNLIAANGNVEGREITSGQLKKDDYYVGIFYHLWHGDFGLDDGAQSKNSLMKGLYNVERMDSATLFDGSTNINQFHYWNEPLYGYYLPADEWVLTRHVELFTMAGIDYLCLDITNPADETRGVARIFKKPVKALFKVLKKFKDQGFDVPKICFYTNTISAVTVEALYDEYYQSGEYDDLWFKPNGKPLIVGITVNNGGGSDQSQHNSMVVTVNEDMLNYFDMKDSKWPFTTNDVLAQSNAMPWMSWECPQTIFSPSLGAERDGYIAVPVAQHGHTYGYTSVSLCPPESHRGYNNATGMVEGDWKDGLSFQQMWDTVHNNSGKIKTVLATGWNEWIAMKQAPNASYVNKPEGNSSGIHFVDVYNNEYSRDIEMMRDIDGYGDNYYLQLMYNLRKLKREAIANINFPTATFDMSMDFAPGIWNEKGTEYFDFSGDAIARNSFDATGMNIQYIDESNRNDIVSVKVTNDETYYYFLVKTLDNITDYDGDDHWMNIFIGTEYGENTFGGFNYVINRFPDIVNGVGTTTVHKYNYGTWLSNGSADIRVKDNYMMVRVPMNILGRSATQTKIRFKVSDNVQNWYVDSNTEHIMDYYVSGDSAPIGRLGYVYGV